MFAERIDAFAVFLPVVDRVGKSCDGAFQYRFLAQHLPYPWVRHSYFRSNCRQKKMFDIDVQLSKDEDDQKQHSIVGLNKKILARFLLFSPTL